MQDEPIDAYVLEDVRDLLRKGRKIEAIKLVVENSNLGLKGAKTYVEELQRRMR